jgi:hypothetical protein
LPGVEADNSNAAVGKNSKDFDSARNF